MSTLRIKNMVCDRCKMVVKSELEGLGYTPVLVELGLVELAEKESEVEQERIRISMSNLGFELINDKKSQVIEQVKTLIINLVHYKNDKLNIKLSDYISHELHHEYSAVSKLFSETEGTTIEQYFIAQKIEKVKELLMYDELSLSQIAFQMHYSSVAHLSRQFKKVTGFTPSHFKKNKDNQRKSLHNV